MQSVTKDLESFAETTMTHLELLERQTEDFNNAQGSLKDYDCPLCKNKGMIQKLIFDEMYQEHRQVVVKCGCLKKRESIRKAKESGLGDYINRRFEDFQVTDDWQRDVKRKAIEYCKANTDEWFVMLGQSGSGKTMLSCIVANYLLTKENKEVLYITWTDFISKIKMDLMSDNAKQAGNYIDTVKRVEVLYIDELLKKYNEADLKYIIEIINYRYTNNLKTIITSERNIKELLDIDEATFGRVVEKSGNYLVSIAKDISKNYRLRNIRGGNSEI